MREIGGHPAVEAVTDAGRVNRITVCSECGRLKTILLLAGDRWYCANCRAAGSARPTQVPVSRPARH